jgi:RNA polymerase sigma factor (sigma-70 family)
MTSGRVGFIPGQPRNRVRIGEEAQRGSLVRFLPRRQYCFLEGQPLSQSLTTRPSLLVRLRDAKDSEAWRQFVELYASLIYGLARKRGLQDADAADVTQEVFHKVSTAIRKLEYDPRCGSFRGWLLTLTRHGLHDFLARRKQPEQGSGDSALQARLEQQPCQEEEETFWDQEYERRVFTWAVERVRPCFKEPTWQAFWQVAVEGKTSGEVARALDMTVGAVYVAKCRVQARLRAEIQDLDCV